MHPAAIATQADLILTIVQQQFVQQVGAPVGVVRRQVDQPSPVLRMLERHALAKPP